MLNVGETGAALKSMSTEELIPQGENSTEAAVGDHEDQMHTFGEYLTGQYDVLKRTLSYLPLFDLGRAALVCSAWNKAASYLLKKRDEENLQMRWHIQCPRRPCDHAVCFQNNNISFRSQLVLGFQQTYSEVRDVFDDISVKGISPDGFDRIRIPGLKGHALLVESDRVEVPILRSKRFPGMHKNIEILPFIFTRKDFKNAAVFYPHTDRFKISLTQCSRETNYDSILSEEMSQQYGPPRGLLVFSPDETTDFFGPVYNSLCDRYRQSIPLAGGIFPRVTILESGQWQSMSNGVSVIGFHGEVECYSAVLTSTRKEDIKPFMKKMRHELGSVDLKKKHRTAIVIRCVGRSHPLQESLMFRKYFPDTPAFILASGGEYANAGYSTDLGEPPAKVKVKTVKISHSYCSVYFIFTIGLSTCKK